MLKLLLIRHGESIGNCEKRMAGHSDDDLTPFGRQQCQQLGQWLRQQNWQPSHIYCSPLRRALASVEALMQPWQWQLVQPFIIAQAMTAQRELHLITPALRAAQTRPKAVVMPELREFDAGILTGLTWAEAQQQYPELCEALLTSPMWVPIPKAETPAAGRDRAAQVITQLLNRHSNQDQVWMISHQWIMEHLISQLMGCDRTWKIDIPNTAVFEFWLDRDRWYDTGMTQGISDLWQIRRFGDVSHLFEELK